MGSIVPSFHRCRCIVTTAHPCNHVTLVTLPTPSAHDLFHSHFHRRTLVRCGSAAHVYRSTPVPRRTGSARRETHPRLGQAHERSTSDSERPRKRTASRRSRPVDLPPVTG